MPGHYIIPRIAVTNSEFNKMVVYLKNMDPEVDPIFVMVCCHFSSFLHIDDISYLQIAVGMYNCLNCRCLEIIEPFIAIQILTIALKWKLCFWSCADILLIREYWHLENRYPSLEEFCSYLENIRNLESDPEQFHQNDKVTSGVDISSMKITATEEYSCSICLENIKIDQMAYKLPCNHVFHANNEECIDETIVKWFEKNKHCPNCRHELHNNTT